MSFVTRSVIKIIKLIHSVQIYQVPLKLIKFYQNRKKLKKINSKMTSNVASSSLLKIAKNNNNVKTIKSLKNKSWMMPTLVSSRRDVSSSNNDRDRRWIPSHPSSLQQTSLGPAKIKELIDRPIKNSISSNYTEEENRTASGFRCDSCISPRIQSATYCNENHQILSNRTTTWTPSISLAKCSTSSSNQQFVFLKTLCVK